MTSAEWSNELNDRLKEKGLGLTPTQLLEARRLLRDAMEEAWHRGNGFDHGMPFDEELLS